jgi:hypothetical protein
MATNNGCSSFLGRNAIRSLIAVLGVAGIVGSGGGGLPDMSVQPTPPSPSPPVVSISPSRVTAEVGATVQFRSLTYASSYQWQRNGVNIAGANDSSYTVVGVNLGDDGAHFSVVARNAYGTSTATALLQVSPLPGVLYEDIDFRMSGWEVTAVAEPAQADAKLRAVQSESGGNPGAFMQVSFEFPPAPSSVRVFHTYLAATYDPARQGAIYGVDMAADCKWITGGTVYIERMLEQAGRRFTSHTGDYCVAWLNMFSKLLSLRADEFVQVDGPACEPGETCPDFSATGAPIRFGLQSHLSHESDDWPGAMTYGIDNWRVTVWRK